MASIDFSKLGGMNSFSTLDEPVSETLMRDLRSVGQKLQIVLTPLGKNSREEVLGKLRDWDLWGPLLVCLMLSTILSSSAPTDSGSVVFASVFVIVWSGAAAVTLNAQLLGGKISFLQSVCILGYCVFPLTVAAMVLLILGFIVNSFVIKVSIVTAGFIWSTSASVVFISKVIKEERRILAVYPVFFFYIFLSWLILAV